MSEHYEPFLSPGEVVIREVGTAALCREFKIARSTAWRWTQPKPRGTGGIVPSCYHRPLLDLAQRIGANLTSEDLIAGRLKQQGCN